MFFFKKGALLLALLVVGFMGVLAQTSPELDEKDRLERRRNLAVGVFDKYVSAASLRDPEQDSAVVNISSIRRFVELFAPNAEIFDDVSMRTKFNIGALDYASMVYDHLPQGVFFTLEYALLEGRGRLGKEKTDSQYGVYLYEYRVKKRMFIRLDNSNKPIGKEKVFQLRFQILVDEVQQNALISNIYLEN